MDTTPTNPVSAPGPTLPPAANGLSETAHLRREQVLDAADAVIAGEGIHRLSLGRIEEKAGMSRGQLTYYFPTKEDILLAVFDRLLSRMIALMRASDGPKPMTGQAWACVQYMFARHLAADGPPADGANFPSLVYTFLAQMSHRADYRAKLAAMYADWRGMMAADFALSGVPTAFAPPRISAALVQALVHGLTMQLAVDPEAFDRGEMLAAIVKVLGPLFKTPDDAAANPGPTRPPV